MTSAPTQPRLPLRENVLHKPLVDLQGAAALIGLECDERQVVDLIQLPPLDPERIEWAWNIAGKDAGKQELRVLASCCPPANRAVRRDFDTVLAEIFTDVLHREQVRRFATIPSAFFAKRLACTRHHVTDLIADKELAALANTRGQRGRTSTPALTWPSVISFLQRRRIQ